ncbi:MAG: TIGR00282 family metallophosphoesterase [Patescibacteria group bacterium]|jgi:hypothetical protein
MNILFIGDIVGRPSRTIIKKHLSEIKSEFDIDFTIANGENLASGKGMTELTYKEMIDAGIDYFTSGNHIWAKKEFVEMLNLKNLKVVRPANYPDNVPGKGYEVVRTPKGKIAIINLIGRVFFANSFESPFKIADEILKKIDNVDAIIVDFHAEATSEKVSLGYYLDGKVTAVVGTHTHIQTADERILPKGTAYITDAGMVGPLNSSLGADLHAFTQGFLYQTPVKYAVSDDKEVVFNGVVIETGENKLAQKIERISRVYNLE